MTKAELLKAMFVAPDDTEIKRWKTIRAKLDNWMTRFEAQPLSKGYKHIRIDRDGNEVMNQGFVKIKLVTEVALELEDEAGNQIINYETSYLYTTMENVASMEKKINRKGALAGWRQYFKIRDAGVEAIVETDHEGCIQEHLTASSLIKDITPVVQHLAGSQYGKFTTMKFSPRSQS